MTQQYLVGLLSVLLGDLESSAAEWRPGVHAVRLEAELSPVAQLPVFAEKIRRLTDEICWTALERGDVSRFCECCEAAAELNEFFEW
jgi:hypothetical protein